MARLWIDATYLKVHLGGRIVSIAVIIAIWVKTDARREVLGLELGTSKVRPIWTKYLRKLNLDPDHPGRRGIAQ
jgi:transposase-like protein